MNSSGISTATSDTVSDTIVKPICLRALERGAERLLALLDVARDVLDHHDRVVDDEPGRDRERHQRQVVEREVRASFITPNVPISESGTATPGMTVARDAAEEEVDHARRRGTIVSTSVNWTSCTDARTVSVRSARIVDVDRPAASTRRELRQERA